jgi:hypothetical protein
MNERIFHSRDFWTRRQRLLFLFRRIRHALDDAWAWVGVALFCALAAAVPSVIVHLIVLYGG